MASNPFSDQSPNPIQVLAIAFDLDGLIFDTEALFFRVGTEMLADRGKVFTHEIMQKMIGRQAPIAGKALKEMASLEESVGDLMAEARRRFLDLMEEAIHPMPGLFALLAHLEHLGLPKCVATSSRRLYAEKLLQGHGLWDHFEFLLAAEDVTNSKPDPEIYRKAAERFQIAPANLLVLEDSPAGVSAAKAAGAFAVAIPHEHSPAAGLSHADRVINRLDAPELFAMLD